VVEYKPCRTKPKGKSDKRSLKIEQQMRKYKAQESVKKKLELKSVKTISYNSFKNKVKE